MTVRLLPCGRRAVLVECDDVLGFQAALTRSLPDGVEELVPAARTLLVRFDPSVTDADRLGALLHRVSPVDSVTSEAGEVVIPVVYTLLDRRSDAVYRERGERKAKAVLDESTIAPQGAAP